MFIYLFIIALLCLIRKKYVVLWDKIMVGFCWGLAPERDGELIKTEVCCF